MADATKDLLTSVGNIAVGLIKMWTTLEPDSLGAISFKRGSLNIKFFLSVFSNTMRSATAIKGAEFAGYFLLINSAPISQEWFQ